jgi:hypothetical protein
MRAGCMVQWCRRAEKLEISVSQFPQHFCDLRPKIPQSCSFSGFFPLALSRRRELYVNVP